MTNDVSTARMLSAAHRALIVGSAITVTVAKARGYRTVTVMADLDRLGFGRSQRLVPALLLPIHGVAGGIVNYQIRPDAPRIDDKGKPRKYEFPAKSQMALDVHPFIREHLGGPAIPLWITEGIRKADAGVSMGLCCIGVPGVWNWRGTNEHGGKTVLPDWEQIALNGRETFIVYDSDVMLKPAVYAALVRLGAALASRGAHVHYVYLPSGRGGTKVGLDDYLAGGHGVDDLLALASTDLRVPPADEAEADPPYAATDAGTVWRKHTPDGAVDVRLANFSAVIIEDVVEDDGAEERRHYVIAATLRGRTRRIEVPALQFNSMTWVGEQLGASAVLEPGQGTKDRLRHAMQTLSGEIGEWRRYAHTGWRLIDGQWLYLHGAGAIGAGGFVPGIDVALRGPLARLALPIPPVGHDLEDAVQASLQLLTLLPSEVAYPLVGATWLAPLRALLAASAPDFVPFLHGPSGSFKSELQALAQGFYGDFSRQSLPVNFSATPNAVERLLFEAKDALVAVDDFHPAGDLREQQAMNQVANRLLRGAGNLAGRARMRADTTLRPALDPRCLAIASGERLPEGHSSMARMYPIAVTPGAIDVAQLTTAQERRHLYPLAMASYLQFLAQRFDGLQEALPQRCHDLRADLQIAGSHRREPGQLAHLLLGLETFFGFALEHGVIAHDDIQAQLRQARAVLVTQAREHGAAQAEEAPTHVFLRYLADGFAAKRVYVEDKRGGVPGGAESWGWEHGTQTNPSGMAQETWRHPASAQLIGVLDGDWLLLYPEQVYQFVVSAAKASGRTFPVDQNTLIRRLDEAGLIATETASGERRRKVNVWVGGSTKRVLKLRRDAVEMPFLVQNREDREGREDRRACAPWQAAVAMAPSREGGKTTATGKVVPGIDDAVTPVLPDLPGLPGSVREEDEGTAMAEEEVEWMATL